MDVQYERTAKDNRSGFFDIDNLSVVGSRDNYNEVVLVKDFISIPSALNYFLFRSDFVNLEADHRALSRSC